MISRWYSIAVILFWMATMSWLIRDKVLPGLIVGDPPTYRTILADQDSRPAEVRWALYLQEEPLGQASSTTRRRDDGTNEIRSRIHLSRLPLAELTPHWMQSLVRMLDGGPLGQRAVALEADSRMEIDLLGRPIGFYSRATFTESRPGRLPGQQNDGPDFDVFMHGVVDGQRMNIKVRSGQLIYNTSVYLPPDALMADLFSPHTHLPGLRVGQTWTVPIYSPLQPPNSPLEILHATVEHSEALVWHGQVVPTLLVTFRANPGSKLSGETAPKAKAWVDAEGNVLRQELSLWSARLVFERMPADATLPPASP